MSSPINYLKRFNLVPRGVIQVGANSGQEIQSYVDGGITHGILIEPLDEPFLILREKARHHPGFVALQALCADEDGRRFSFYVASNRGQSSSLFEPGENLKELYPHIGFESSQELSAITLDSLLDSMKMNAPETDLSVFDLLCMDTQGSELLVLKGAGKTLENVNAVWTEVSQQEIYKGGVLLNELIAFMDGIGFMLVALTMNRSLWGDALFIRRKLRS